MRHKEEENEKEIIGTIRIYVIFCFDFHIGTVDSNGRSG
jgi:hypothetical protein